MCLLVLCHRHDERYQLVFAGNRDELHARPAQAAYWWNDDSRILAGRDLEAGGTWLGITRGGRFAVVTNFRAEPSQPTVQSSSEQRSRGEIVSGFLRDRAAAESFASSLQAHGERYRGFSAIVGDGSELWFVSNRSSNPERLASGIYGLSNQLLDVPWPKVVRAKAALANALDAPFSTETLLDLLDDRKRVPEHIARGSEPEREPDTDRIVDSIFVSSPRYGTRCSTAITVSYAGDVEFAERSFGAEGNTIGTERFEFRIDGILTNL